jgi:predicted PurR-regulated permease PerM
VDVPTGRPESYNWDEKRPPRWLPRAILYVFGAIVALVALRSFVERIHDLLVILLVSLFASFAIEPAVDWLADRGWRRGAATALVFVVVTVVGGVLVFLVVDLVVQQIRTLVDEAPDMVAEATKWVNDRFHTKITTDSIIEQLRGYQDDFANTAGDVGGRVVSITGSLLGLLFNGLTVALFTFYLVADGPHVRRSICSVLPQGQQRTVLGLWELSIHKTGGYLYSRVLLASISAFCTWIALTIIGVPGPVALAVWSGVVSQFVPVIGTYIGGALPAIVALLDDPVSALWVIGFILIYQQVENYLLSPRVSSRTMAIHPAVAFGSAIVGAQILGPIGAFLALPAAAIVQAFVSSYLHRYELVESSALPDDADADPEVDAAADEALAKADTAGAERPGEPDG